MEENTLKDPVIENEENNVEPKEETPQTDNLSENTDTEKKGFFGKKSNKERAKIQELETELEKIKEEKADLNDRFLRLFSEFDNYKKRVGKEKLELLSTASEQVIVNLLPIVDDFERAIAANENVTDLQSIKEGFNLIYNKMGQMLKRFDVEEIAAKGEVFDTDFHEAVTHFPTEKEEDKGKVIDVTEKGYTLKNKVIRYAKVIVAQ